jgi:hypothetical protein
MNLGVLNLINIFFLLIITISAKSEPISGSLAEIQILDKITAKVKTLQIKVNESKTFESLNIEVYACYKNPPEEIPENYVLLKIFDNINFKKINKNNLIYQGWMISSSPATTPLEHPIYDLWLISCKIEIDF